MAASAGGSGRQTLNEINVTPLVDVMLVLLIIFMVTAPLIQQGVEVMATGQRAGGVNLGMITNPAPERPREVKGDAR